MVYDFVELDSPGGSVCFWLFFVLFFLLPPFLYSLVAYWHYCPILLTFWFAEMDSYEETL